MNKPKIVAENYSSPYHTKARQNLTSHISLLTSDSRGITLIALVITIIVMLILVTVTIRVATDGNLFKHAGNAVKETKNAVLQENYVGEGKIQVGGVSYNSIEEYVATKTADEGAGGGAGGSGATATPGTKVTVKTAYTSNNKTAQIPAGFAVSGIASEQSIDNGLVIYYQGEAESIDWSDPLTACKTYDQFVWIPVVDNAGNANPNSMFICRNKTASNGDCNIELVNGVVRCSNPSHKTGDEFCTNIAGRLYATSTGNNFNPSQTAGTWTQNSGLREPDVLTSYSSSSPDLATLQDEYNDIAKSVIENKGFWVGRYETSGMASSGTVKVVAGTTTGIRAITWTNMYNNQKAFIENSNGINSYGGMITGAAYDQVMLFVNGKTKYLNGTTADGTYNVKATDQVAHNLSNPYETGNTNYTGTSGTYKDMVCNIYDLEGNVCEWTTEANDTGSRVRRGGRYNDAFSASYRSVSIPTSTNNDIGSRSALFVK